MTVIADPEFWLRLFSIGVLNLLLSGDNAIVVWGAGLLAHLMNRYAWIVWLGGGLLGYVAGEMFMEDPIVRRGLGEVAGPLHYPVPLVVGLVVTACGWWFARGHRHRVRVPENL